MAYGGEGEEGWGIEDNVFKWVGSIDKVVGVAVPTVDKHRDAK